MTPARWHQITEIFHAALARTGIDRDAFLESACRHDPSLRREVDAMVLAAQAAICVAQFMKQPNPQEKLQELEKVYSYDRTNIITKGGWDKMPGEEQGNFAVARACADGLEVLMKK